ncbi:MAG: DNA-binding transcriptional MerR regulator [Chlamydiales bacterium]|jgi:DNA-binding transcriptional MerR regulator
MDLFSIGEFSRMSGITVKTLRFYHEKQLLVPALVEGETGYRNYDRRNLENAQVIVALRGLNFGLDVISEILSGQPYDGNILVHLERQKGRIQGEIETRADIVQVLDSIIAQENHTRTHTKQAGYEIEEKSLSPLLVGGIRMKGRYSECGKVFGQLGRKLGRHIAGKAIMLCHDEEYREDDADFEPCMPLRKPIEVSAVDVRVLPGGRCLSLVHVGPYDRLSRSYGRILEYARSEDLRLLCPSREVYIKGPGMIFKGNPEKHLTEIQFLIED